MMRPRCRRDSALRLDPLTPRASSSSPLISAHDDTRYTVVRCVSASISLARIRREDLCRDDDQSAVPAGYGHRSSYARLLPLGNFRGLLSRPHAGGTSRY